jgi:wobble nucleotide-excising tRNase
MSSILHPFQNLKEVVFYLRGLDKKYVLLYAYNGTGKTRLSMEFKEAGKVNGEPDTLYFNAFTEDLFSWDNDLESDTHRVLIMNKDSRFFSGIQEQDMENKIRPLLQRYADFNFLIDYPNWEVNFIREEKIDGTPQNIEYIKISRGEENIFIWCFFLAVAQLAIDKQEGYDWVKYIYIDDPISSLDDNNAIAVASHLAQMLKTKENDIKVVVSSHHTLFYNVMWNELNQEKKKFQPYFFTKGKDTGSYALRYTKDTPFFHHVALLKELKKAADTGELYTYHFSLLRNVLERTATFHGFNSFSDCIKRDGDDPDDIVHTRMINVMSHGNYSLFEPTEMIDENKDHFRKILNNFMENYRFNSELFVDLNVENDT